MLFEHPPRVESIAKDFSEAMDRLIARLEQATDGAAEFTASPARWSAAQVAYHVAAANEAFAAVITGNVAGAVAAAEDFREPSWAEIQRRVPQRADASKDVWPPARVTRREAVTLLRMSRENFLAMLHALPVSRGLGHCLTHGFVGTISLYQVAEWAAAHVKRHNAQAKRAISEMTLSRCTAPE
jgi:hypothetical protein